MKAITADIGIVAAGPAGLCAAAAAAELGASVVVFEKRGTFGGSANMGMGPFAVESRIQRRSMNNLRKEDAFRQFMDYVHWRANAKLVRDYFWKSGNTIDWLENMGVQFVGAVKNFPDSEATWHIVRPESGGQPGPCSARAMNKVIFQYAKDLGVEFYFNAPVQKLIKEDNAVVGFLAQDKTETYEVHARAVILATGGFGSNPQMIKDYTGYTLDEDITTFKIPGVTGDGLKMAWDIGAGKSQMTMERTPGPALPGVTLGKRPNATLFNQAGPIAINKSGWRICDESVMQNASVSGSIIDYQQDHTVFMVADDSMVKHYREHGVDFPSEVFRVDPTEGFEEAWSQYSQEFPEAAYTAGSLEELALSMGVNVDNFLETVKRYNEFCETGFDDDFGKHREYMHPLKGDHFYAIRLRVGAYGSLGGIRIDHKLRVLTDDYQVIPGLWAAGSDVCDIYSDTYYYYFPGNTMGFALNTGRMAGEYATDYVQKCTVTTPAKYHFTKPESPPCTNSTACLASNVVLPESYK